MRARLGKSAYVAALLAASALAACGDSGTAAPVGSAENPIVAKTSSTVAERSNEGAKTDGEGEQPGYKALVDGQQSKPRTRFSPCDLVSKADARAILGAAVEQPLEAVQGPTCIYRTRDGEGFVTVAVQAQKLSRLKPMLRQRRRVDAAGRTAYCGQSGQAMLHVRLAAGRVLSVGAPCDIAKQFADKAVRELRA